HEAHRRSLGDGDESRASRRTPQRIDPPGQVVVRVLAQHGQHQVPTLAGELSHRARQIRRGVDLESTVVGPLSQVLQQTAGASALAGDHENPKSANAPLPGTADGTEGSM